MKLTHTLAGLALKSSFCSRFCLAVMETIPVLMGSWFDLSTLYCLNSTSVWSSRKSFTVLIE